MFVLTHHARDPVEMEGGTTFHFVTDGIEAALEQARDGRRRPRRQHRRRRRGDAASTCGPASSTSSGCTSSPVLLGAGERLFEDMDGGPAGFEIVELVSSPAVAHYTFRRA